MSRGSWDSSKDKIYKHYKWL